MFHKCGHTSMPQVGFEPMTSVFKLSVSIYAFDCMATGIGSKYMVQRRNYKGPHYAVFSSLLLHPPS